MSYSCHEYLEHLTFSSSVSKNTLVWGYINKKNLKPTDKYLNNLKKIKEEWVG